MDVSSDKESDLEARSSTAWYGKKVLKKLADLAQRIFLNEDQDRLMQWQQMLSKYLEVMKVTFRHEDFLEEEVEEFQVLVDDWSYHYVKLAGLSGITNYMHLLGAGHLYFYLKKWGNLYRYQQWSWGMKNSVIASFLFLDVQEEMMVLGESKAQLILFSFQLNLRW